jgi:hypothetical protein
MPTSQEKEWFANDNREIVGIVAEDLVDNDWFYVLFRRKSDGELETEDMGCDIGDRMTARGRLLDAMEAELRGQS